MIIVYVLVDNDKLLFYNELMKSLYSLRYHMSKQEVCILTDTRTLYDGDIGIFIVDGDAFIKQFKTVPPSEDEVDDYRDSEGIVHNKVILVSLNEKYADRVINPFQQIHIVGRVLN